MISRMGLWMAAMLGALQFCRALSPDTSARAEWSVWEFEDGDSGGWGNESALAMGVETMILGGVLRGTVIAQSVGLSSPVFDIRATDRTTLAIRMAYSGAAREGAVQIRARESSRLPLLYGRGSAPWPSDAALSSASARSDGVASVAVASSATSNGVPAIGVPLDEIVWEQRFPVVGDGVVRTYYVPLYPNREAGSASKDRVGQVRIRPAVGDAVAPGQSFEIESIGLLEAPTVLQVTGCGVIRAGEAEDAVSDVGVEGWRPFAREVGSSSDVYFDELEDIGSYKLGSDNSSLRFGKTYDCVESGGDRIRLRGRAFGEEGLLVWVNGRPCVGDGAGGNAVGASGEEGLVECVVPPGRGRNAKVRVENAAWPGLWDENEFLSYAVGPEPPARVVVGNEGARHVGVFWEPPADWRDAVTTTGYVVEMRAALDPQELFRRFGAEYKVAGGIEGGGIELGLDRHNRPVLFVAATSEALQVSGEGGTSRFPRVQVSRQMNQSFEGNLEGMADFEGVEDLEGVEEDQKRELLERWKAPWTLAATTTSWWSALEAAPAINSSASLPESTWGPWGVVAHTGNVTATTVLGLRPGRPYQVRVASVSEDTVRFGSSESWRRLDRYGQRPRLLGAKVGAFSEAVATSTLEADIDFAYFDANASLAYGSMSSVSGVGPLGDVGGEGAHGLVFVGSASVAGCNATHTCCDGFAWAGRTEPGPAGWRTPAANGRRWRSHDEEAVDGTGMDGAFGYRRNWFASESYADGYPPFSGAVDAHEFALASNAPNSTLFYNTLPSLPVPSPLNRTLPPYASCRLACASTARISAPYLNTRAMRDATTLGLASTAPISNSADPVTADSSLPLGVRGAPASRLTNASLPAPPTSHPNGMAVLPASALVRPPTEPCGPALRLTGSHGSQVGAAWYARPQQVAEGFEAVFMFRMASPSFFCRNMDDAHTNCHARGGDGLAFVVQNAHPAALGRAGAGMGFAGIPNSIAVEFDSWHNYDLEDAWENHVAVFTRGRRANNNHHDNALGEALLNVPDLAQSTHHVRVRYDPRLDPTLLRHPAFASSGEAQRSLIDSWGNMGFGTLSVFFDHSPQPSLIVPLNLQHTLDLKASNGRAFVGFTAATGNDVFQTHDILEWSFTQLRRHLPEQ